MRGSVHQQQERQPHALDFPRETFIALRARRQSYRIATDVLYEREYDDESALRPAVPQKRCRQRTLPFPRYITLGSIILLAIMAFCAIAVAAFAIGEGLIQMPKRL